MAGRPPTREAPIFGKRLAVLRKERGLTQEELAKILGVTRKAVDYYERRAKNPSAEVLAHVAKRLDVSAGWLMGAEDVARIPVKRGPPSHLEERIQQIRQLPKKEQEVVLRMLDGLLASAR